MANDLIQSATGLAFKFWPGAESPNQKFPKPPLLALHGLLGSHKNFASFAKHFSQMGYPVLCLDARNHGASVHSAQFDYPTQAQDLEKLLAWLESQNYGGIDWGRIIAVGHSMGGRSAMMYALLYPKRIAALISVDVVPSLQNPDINIARIVAAMRAAEVQLPHTIKRKEVENILRTELSALGSSSEAVLQFLLLCNLLPRFSGKNASSGYRWAANLEAIEANLQNIVCWPARWLEENWKLTENHSSPQPCNPKLPLLLIAGGRSPYVQEQGWQLLLKYFPHLPEASTEKKIIKNAYHWPHTETPGEFQALVTEFLQRRPAV